MKAFNPLEPIIVGILLTIMCGVQLWVVRPSREKMASRVKNLAKLEKSWGMSYEKMYYVSSALGFTFGLIMIALGLLIAMVR